MDAAHFDNLTRALSNVTSRRVTLGQLAASALIALGLAADEGAMLAQSKKKKKKRKKKKPKKKRRRCRRQGQRLCGGTCQECCNLSQCPDGTPFCSGGMCVECNIPLHCTQKYGDARPFCSEKTCTACSESGPWALILSGGALQSSPIIVDDDWSVFHNGSLLFEDADGSAGSSSPIAFQGRSGDNLRVVAKDVQGACQFISGLWLHRTCDGAFKQVSDLVDRGCDFPPGHEETFLDHSFSVGRSGWLTFPS